MWCFPSGATQCTD